MRLYLDTYDAAGVVEAAGAAPDAAKRLPRRRRHHDLRLARVAARAGAEDLRLGRVQGAAAFRTGKAALRRGEIILRADVGADQVMDDRKEREARGAARGTHRLSGIDLHSASPFAATASVMKSENVNQRLSGAGGGVGVVHVDLDGRVERRQRQSGIEANARDLRRLAAGIAENLAGIERAGHRQDRLDGAENAPVAVQHEDPAADGRSDDARVRDVPGDIDVAGVEDLGDRRARHQRLAGVGELRRDDAADRRDDAAAVESLDRLLDAPVQPLQHLEHAGPARNVV